MKNVPRQRATSFKFNIKKHGELNTEPSQTVPDDSYTVKDILSRFTRGIDPMLTRMGQYDGDQNENLDDDSFVVNPIQDINDLTDIDDLEEFLRVTKKNEELLKKAIQEREREQKQKISDTQP